VVKERLVADMRARLDTAEAHLKVEDCRLLNLVDSRVHIG